jgi:hypothetical protein
VRYEHWVLVLGLLVSSACVVGAARADIPPEGLCVTEKAGQACDNPVDAKGKEGTSPGVCVQEKCSRATPDGQMSYDCLMCRPKDDAPSTGGTGGGTGAPGGGNAGGSSAGTPSTQKKSSGGCSIGRGAGSKAPLLAAALAAWGIAARRRRAALVRS